MADKNSTSLHVFYCYAREDQALRDKLERHLTDLKRNYNLQTWFDRQIKPGEQWEKTINERLNTADLILLLISPAFMASDYCYNKEMQQALIRHTSGEAKVIPILLRPVHWRGAPFSTIQMLPSNTLPVTRWPDMDDAFYEVASGIRRVVDKLLSSDKVKEWNEKGAALFKLQRFEEALVAYEEAIRLDPTLAYVYHNKGRTLFMLQRFEEALVAYEEAIALQPNFGQAYFAKGKTLDRLAQETYERYQQLANSEHDQARQLGVE